MDIESLEEGATLGLLNDTIDHISETNDTSIPISDIELGGIPVYGYAVLLFGLCLCCCLFSNLFFQCIEKIEDCLTFKNPCSGLKFCEDKSPKYSPRKIYPTQYSPPSGKRIIEVGIIKSASLRATADV